MARSRNLKPGFFKNEQLGECSDGARLLFAGLWTLADYRGVLEYRPKRIHAELFPYDRKNIEKLIAELEAQDLVLRCQKDDKSFLLVCAFEKHQNPHKKERDAGTDMPDPCEFRDKPGQAPTQNDPGTELAVPLPSSLIPLPSSKSVSYSEDFEIFWKASPKTGNKKRAGAQWARLSAEQRQDAGAGVVRQRKWRKAWAEADPDNFIPPWKHMERWLRDEQWEDFLDKPKIKTSKHMDESERDRLQEQRARMDQAREADEAQANRVAANIAAKSKGTTPDGPERLGPVDVPQQEE